MTDRCPVCGIDLPDRTEAWLHLREAHASAPLPQRDPGGRDPAGRDPSHQAPPPGAPGVSGGIWRQGYANAPVTMLIIAVTVAAWLLDRLLHYGFGIELSQALGGNGQLYGDGQWWRLITPVLVHFGPIHLAFNMAWLYQLGPAVERIMKRGAFLATYLGTAMAGNVCSDLVYYHRANFLSGGASGAIYGLGGVLVGAWALARELDRHRRGSPPATRLVFNSQAVRSLAIFFGLYLVIGQALGPVDSAAHFGGGLLGLGIGAVLAWVHNGPGAALRA